MREFLLIPQPSSLYIFFFKESIDLNFSSFAPVRVLGSLGAACALVALAGCQGEKVVAHIGSTTITEKAFNDRAQSQTQQDVLSLTDAGSSALTHLILDEAVGQLAKEKQVEPTPQAVTAYATYETRSNAGLRRAIEQGTLTVANFEPSARYNLEIFALGVDGAKAKPEDVQTAYDGLKTQPAVGQTNPMTGQPGQNNPIKIAGELTVKLVSAKDEATATKILAQLKTDDNFKAAAQAAGLTGPALDNAGQDTPLPIDQIKKQLPDVYAALTQTPAGQYVSKPMPIPNAKTPKQYLVAKIVKNTPEVVFTLEEARPFLEQLVLNNQKPDWQDHQTTLLNDRLRKMLADNSIQINVPRYENVKTKILPLLIDESEKAAKARAAQRLQAAQMQQMQQQMQQKNAPKPGAATPAPPKPGANGKP